MDIIKGIKNEELLKVVSKKNNDLITKITEEFLNDYGVSILNSCLPNSIISQWYLIDKCLEEDRGESVTIFESPNYQRHPGSSLFDFTANVIRRTLVKNNLDSLVDDLANMEVFDIPLENGDIMLNYTYRVREIGFKINHSIIERYMNEMNKIYGEMYGIDDFVGFSDDNIEAFKPTTLEYESKSGFNGGKKEVRVGPITFSIYSYIGFITEYLVNNPQIKYWNMKLKCEEFIKKVCELEFELELCQSSGPLSTFAK